MKFKQNILIIIVILICFSCDQKKFNDVLPYAIEIKEVRSYFKAIDIKKRLEKFDIKSYIVLEKTSDGDWFKIISGAEESLENIKKYKSELENLIPIEDIQIVNFEKVKNKIEFDFKENLEENKRLKSKSPNLPKKIYNLINKFPDDKNFIVKRFFVSNAPDSIKNIRKFKSAYDNINHDLPRGISLKNLMKESECLAEVIYEDNIFGDRVTLDIVKLKKKLDLEIFDQSNKFDEIANHFAELVLETGNYNYENKIRIKASSFKEFSGYKVTIQPKKSSDNLRTYFILVSLDSEYLVFSQSTEKSDEEILDIMKELGKNDGLNSYDEFYNSFYALPNECNINDTFISISSEKLSRKYARDRGNAKWAKKMVGHWQTSVYYNGIKNGNWALSFFDLLGKSKVSLIYDNLYIKAQKRNSSTKTIDLFGKKGVISKGRYPFELSFPGNRFVVTLNNFNRGKLTGGDMVTVAECLQLK